jgi:hypothetical protein
MKKIIKSSMLVLAVCFIAGKASAQLTSDKPAMTAQQVTDLLQKRSVSAKPAATTVSVSSDKPAPVQPVQTQKATAKTEQADPASVKIAPQSATVSNTLPTASNQGGVQPATTEPVTAKPGTVQAGTVSPAESKAVPVPVQEEKPKSKD